MLETLTVFTPNYFQFSLNFVTSYMQTIFINWRSNWGHQWPAQWLLVGAASILLCRL